MVRVPCCEKELGLKKGPWTPEEDQKLIAYIETHGHSSWRALPKQAGLARCGKSCRLRWTNYLRPGIKRGDFSPHEENSIIQLHAILGNRWSTIATHLPGRTDNEIKNHWNTRLRKRLLKMGIDPSTHRPWPLQPQPPHSGRTVPSINTSGLLLSLLHPQLGLPSPPADHPSALLKSLLLNAAGPPSCTTHAAAGPPPAPPAAAVSSSSPFPPAPAIDPTLLAAAETRLILDCLKIGSAPDSPSSSEHQLNQLITRLLLVKLLQQGSSYGAPSPSFPSFDNVAHIHSNIGAEPRMCSQLSPDNLPYIQGLHAVLGGGPAPLQHESTAAASTVPASAYVNPNFPAPVNNGNSYNGVLPMSVLSSMSSSSYQQRLLQALPFLAESVVEPCTADAADDSSSNQLRNANQLISSPPSSASLPCQQPPLWLNTGTENPTPAAGMPLLGGMPTTFWPAWEELLMRGVDRDIASSSTVNTSSSSSTLSSTGAPGTPNNSLNVQDYWSNLLNLISPNINPHP